MFLCLSRYNRYNQTAKFVLICALGAGLVLGVLGLSDTVFSVFSPPAVAEASIETGASKYIGVRFVFTKPIKRRELRYSVSPIFVGEWRFEAPMVGNHLFREAVFLPATNLKEGVVYTMDMSGIQGFGAQGRASSYTFAFHIPGAAPGVLLEESSVPAATQSAAVLSIPLDWQDYPLSCEAASLKMALGYKGVVLGEDEILARIGYADPIQKKGSVWGDPHMGFVGDVRGKICETGFGVFWDRVGETASAWRKADVVQDGTLQDIVSAIDSGDPVIIWGVIPSAPATLCFWETPGGSFIEVPMNTHVRLVVGYIGDPQSPEKIVVNDPLAGVLYWTPEYFMQNWASYRNSGVIVR